MSAILSATVSASILHKLSWKGYNGEGCKPVKGWLNIDGLHGPDPGIKLYLWVPDSFRGHHCFGSQP